MKRRNDARARSVAFRAKGPMKRRAHWQKKSLEVSVDSVAQWAGVGAAFVVNATHRAMTVIIALHNGKSVRTQDQPAYFADA